MTTPQAAQAAVLDAVVDLVNEAKTQRGVVRGTMVRDAAAAYWLATAAPEAERVARVPFAQ